MPIDPKKFKKVVTNHFDNLTEEEFLKTLQKSSPHLFDESSEEKRDTLLTNRIETLDASSKINILGSILNQKQSFLSRAIILTGGLLLVGFIGSFLATINTSQPSNASQVFTSQDKFQCNINGDDVVLLVKIGSVSRPFIRFVDNFTGDSKINRCKTISNNFTKYTKQSGLYVSISIRNGRSILCASNKNGECIKDENGGELLPLSPAIDPKRYLQLLFELNRNNPLNSSPIFRSQDFVYLE
jgi:Circadian oscillating protein COP23